jgi:hypothetical protein
MKTAPRPMAFQITNHFKSDFRLRRRDKVERVAMSRRRCSNICWVRAWPPGWTAGGVSDFLELLER